MGFVESRVVISMTQSVYLCVTLQRGYRDPVCHLTSGTLVTRSPAEESKGESVHMGPCNRIVCNLDLIDVVIWYVSWGRAT